MGRYLHVGDDFRVPCDPLLRCGTQNDVPPSIYIMTIGGRGSSNVSMLDAMQTVLSVICYGIGYSRFPTFHWKDSGIALAPMPSGPSVVDINIVTPSSFWLPPDVGWQLGITNLSTGSAGSSRESNLWSIVGYLSQRYSMPFGIGMSPNTNHLSPKSMWYQLDVLLYVGLITSKGKI